MDAYTIAYHNAHMDPTDPAKWAAVAREARALRDAATDMADRMQWRDTAHAARCHWHVARQGINPTSDDGRAMVAERI